MTWFGVGGRLESPSTRLIAALSLNAVLSVAPSALAELPPPTVVVLKGRDVHLSGAPTVRELLVSQGMRLEAGRLLDISGAALNPAADPVKLIVNGRDAYPSAPLKAGDRVDVHGGRDSYEPSIVQTFANAGGNPQYKLGSGSVTVRRGLISKAIIPVETQGKGPPLVALTFDDGPSPDATPLILDELRRARIKATFFVVGTMAAAYPQLVRREIAEGMTVGNHTWTHARIGARDASFARGQLTHTSELLKTLGAEVTVFRPPYGTYTPETVRVASSLGLRTIMWTVDSIDYRKPAPSTIVRNVMRQLKPGSIILMHDGGGDRSRTVAALRMLIEQIRQRGYGFSVLR